MLTPLTIRQQQLIVASFRKVFQTGNIDHLTKSAYNFIYQASGFIAHYNLYGFREEYRDVDYLKRSILAHVGANQWRNFHPTDRDYAYYMGKRDLYNRIVDEIVATANDKEQMRQNVDKLKSSFYGWSSASGVVLC